MDQLIRRDTTIPYIQYNQKQPWFWNYCTIIATITAISNTVKREVSDEDIKWCANAIGRKEGAWGLPGVTVRRVVERWNVNFPEQVKYKHMKTEDCYMRCQKGKFAIVWFRYSDDFSEDLFEDCVLNSIPTGKKKWGHAVTLCKWLTIIDNYENSRACNVRHVADKDVLLHSFETTWHLIEKI